MAPAPSRVAIVGAGAVAQALGRLLKNSGEPVVALASRTRAHAEDAVRFIGAPVEAIEIRDVPNVATRVIIAVKDEAIASVAAALAGAGFRSGVALHTCGAKGPDALSPLAANGVSCGLMHPMQTIPTPDHGVRSLAHSTFGITGDAPAVAWAESLVARLDGRAVRLRADRLREYHAGAVMASNAVVAVLDAALALLQRAGVERQPALDAIGALAEATVVNVRSAGPELALTGPIARGDAGTIAAHMAALLDVHPTISELYEAAARRLLVVAEAKGVPAASLRAIERALEGIQTAGALPSDTGEVAEPRGSHR